MATVFRSGRRLFDRPLVMATRGEIGAGPEIPETCP
jgi:hypothetical protein